MKQASTTCRRLKESINVMRLQTGLLLLVLLLLTP